MIPQTLTNTNLFIDGVSFAGDVPSLTLPKLAVKTEQYRAGGMDAPVSIDMGLEAMEAKFSTNGARREALNFFGLADQSAFNGVFRGSFKGQKGASVPVVATLRGLLKEVDPRLEGRRESRVQVRRCGQLLQAGSRWPRGLRDRSGQRCPRDQRCRPVGRHAQRPRPVRGAPDMTQENRLPGWLTLDADAALVRLSRPAQCNGSASTR